MLIDRLDISERRACRITGQARSTQRRKPVMADEEKELRRWLVEFSRKRPRFGYRRAHAIAKKNGFRVNRKKIQRIWREEGLKVTHKAKKRSRLGNSATEARHLEAEYPNHVWALDYQDDQTSDGRRLRILNVVHEFTREVRATQRRDRSPPMRPLRSSMSCSKSGCCPGLHPLRQRPGAHLPRPQ